MTVILLRVLYAVRPAHDQRRRAVPPPAALSISRLAPHAPVPGGPEVRGEARGRRVLSTLGTGEVRGRGTTTPGSAPGGRRQTDRRAACTGPWFTNPENRRRSIAQQ